MKKNKTILLFGCMLAMTLCVSAQQSQSNGNTSNAKQTKVQPEAKNQAAAKQKVYGAEIQATDASLIYEAQHKQGGVKSNSSLSTKKSSKKISNVQPNESSQGKK